MPTSPLIRLLCALLLVPSLLTAQTLRIYHIDVLLIQFGNFRYFVGGDIETATETKIADRDLVIAVDVYQADHHGAENGSSQGLLDDMLPTVIVISNGSNNLYDHPRTTTLARMTGLSPTPTIFQTNKFLHSDPRGDNVADAFIANLSTSGPGDPILVTVNATATSYDVTYGTQSHTFPVKQRGTGSVVIESLLPDPTSGPDRTDEEVVLRNDGNTACRWTGGCCRTSAGVCGHSSLWARLTRVSPQRFAGTECQCL